MIGCCAKWVVTVQNYLKACLICKMHSKSMQKNETLDMAVWDHECPLNQEGSSKGMEAKTALEIVNRVWLTSETRTFIMYNKASTKAYMSHSFADLDALLMPPPTTKAGEPKAAKRDHKGRPPKNHSPITFLVDLCHCVQTFGKYL
jgi:hypothetical protein